MKELPKQLMNELEENGFSFYGPRQNLALSIMSKYLQAAAALAPQEPSNASK